MTNWEDPIRSKSKALDLLSNRRAGRPRTRVRLTGQCEWCGKTFSWLARLIDETEESYTASITVRYEPIRQFCSKRCHLAKQQDGWRKLPVDAVLMDLYRKGLTPKQIAGCYTCHISRVHRRLRKLIGRIPRHLPGCKYCSRPVETSRGKRIYGQVCRFHRHLRQAQASLRWKAKQL